MTVVAAYPYIEVTVDTSALQPVAQRSPGVLAVVGATAAGSSRGCRGTQHADAGDHAGGRRHALFERDRRGGGV